LLKLSDPLIAGSVGAAHVEPETVPHDDVVREVNPRTFAPQSKVIAIWQVRDGLVIQEKADTVRPAL